MRRGSPAFREFVENYLDCLLWQSTDFDTAEPLDKRYSLSDMAWSAFVESVRDCAGFFEAHEADFDGRYAQAAHDFCLTRNRHGSGFWDGDWPDKVGERLTEAAHVYGSASLCPGADGRLFLING